MHRRADMPVHIRLEPDALLLVLERDGEEPATRRANGGEQVLLFAVTLFSVHMTAWRALANP
jgi:hypothetical protein